MIIRKFKNFYTIFLLFTLFYFQLQSKENVLAQELIVKSSQDARVKEFYYQENKIYELKAHYGFSTLIEFSKEENIETVSIGDSLAWQISKAKNPNFLFIKPVEEHAQTNMNVITNKRVYTFELNAYKAASNSSKELTFKAKFIYPHINSNDLNSIFFRGLAPLNPLEGSPSPHLNSALANYNYSFAGAKSIRPMRAFDDGKFTYLELSQDSPMPAVFEVDMKGNEKIVNFSIQGNHLIIQGTAKQYTLRDGDVTACVFNKLLIAQNSSNTAKNTKNSSLRAFHPIPKRKPSSGYLADNNETGNGHGVFARLATLFSNSSQLANHSSIKEISFND